VLILTWNLLKGFNIVTEQKKLKAAVESFGEIKGGVARCAKACGVTPEAVKRWLKKGLPRTETTGETNYAEIIASNNSVYSKDELILESHPKKQ
jgi:hypothetical protein